MATPSPANLRAFVRRHTRLLPVPGVPGVRLQLADDVTLLCRLAGSELRQSDPALPFWAFAWAGGLAVARYLVDHPDEVTGRRVLDMASGSGLCAIVALRCGAASAHAVDVDPLSEAAVAVNARANGVRIGFSRQDLLSAPPPPYDVILAGDVLYEETMAIRMLDWLRLAARGGTRVLLGDPGRTYLPPGLERLAAYRVHTSRELEDAEIKESAVFTFPLALDGRARKVGHRRRRGYSNDRLYNPQVMEMARPDTLSTTFAALADPTRRAILARLAMGEATVTDLAAPFDMSQPAVSKHLRVLERAGLIEQSRQAQWRPRRLQAGPLRDIADWVNQYRSHWEESFERLDEYLRDLQGIQQEQEKGQDHGDGTSSD